jgi:hypothetical protein
MIETGNTSDLRGVIAQRAYELYQLRGGHPGGEYDDWLEAERQVLSSSNGTAPATAGEPPAPEPARKRAAKTPAAMTIPRKRTKKKED